MPVGSSPATLRFDLFEDGAVSAADDEYGINLLNLFFVVVSCFRLDDFHIRNVTCCLVSGTSWRQLTCLRAISRGPLLQCPNCAAHGRPYPPPTTSKKNSRFPSRIFP